MKPVILVVEDDPDVRMLETMALEAYGYEVVSVANGCEAFAVLDGIQPTLILLDLMMPVMDGLTFLSERRVRGRATDVPVVCVSAGTGEMLGQALALGACAALPKPMDFEVLGQLAAHYAAAR